MGDQTSFYVGVDVGRTRNPSALVLVEVDFPGNPERDPPARYQIRDVRKKRGVSFGDIVEECLRIDGDLDEDVTFAVDRVGVGAGLPDMMHAAGLPCYGVAMTGGSGRTVVKALGWELNAVKNAVVEELVGASLRQGRLLMPRGVGDDLAAELMNVSREISDSGNVIYKSPNKSDGTHGDCVSALMCALVPAWHLGRHWVPLQREARGMKRARREKKPTHEARPSSGRTRRGGDTARNRIAELREQREAQARRDMIANNPWDRSWQELSDVDD